MILLEKVFIQKQHDNGEQVFQFKLLGKDTKEIIFYSTPVPFQLPPPGPCTTSINSNHKIILIFYMTLSLRNKVQNCKIGDQ